MSIRFPHLLGASFCKMMESQSTGKWYGYITSVENRLMAHTQAKIYHHGKPIFALTRLGTILSKRER